uniref:hypothetical protein n=1 Tax=Eubacterium cellulosolvens TaxID=29322 RepID=UPI0004806580|nr:hypothetical protein [[Eubacterium] cellulosolvens]
MKRRVIFFAGVLLAGLLAGAGMTRFVTGFGEANGAKKAGRDGLTSSVSEELLSGSSEDFGDEMVVPAPESIQVFRLGFPANGAHFFTADRREKEQLEEQGWSYEGIAFEAPTESAVPVQRMTNPADGSVRYLADLNLVNELTTGGWQSEGVAWYSDEEMRVPVYAVSLGESFHYTTSQEEAQVLVAQGWTDGGIAWYAKDAGGGVSDTNTDMDTRTTLMGVDFSDVYNYSYVNRTYAAAGPYSGDEFRTLIYYISVELPQGHAGKEGVTDEQIAAAQAKLPAEGLMRLGPAGMNEVDGVWYLFDERGIWTNHLAGQTLDDSMNDRQQALVQTCIETPSPGPGMCAMYVSQVWAALGYEYPYGDAVDMYNNWCNAGDYASLKVGMIVAVATHPHSEAGRQYGHIGFYVGNKHVMDNVGVIRTVDLSSWLEYYGPTSAPKWGWTSNISLTDDAAPSDQESGGDAEIPEQVSSGGADVPDQTLE